jgi:ubiquinone/menaquinone biosynthesis C-methylase UbiE
LCRPPAEFVQAAAEDLPLPSDSFDVVYSVYMFHEMPSEARDAALKEMARLLKPGGTLVICDSTQVCERVPYLSGTSPAYGSRRGCFDLL